MVVDGIKVTGMSGDGSLLLLPELYTRRETPFDKEEIATPDKIKEQKHLRSIWNETEQNNDIQVGFLISANYMKALEPTKIIHSEGGGSKAYKLGCVGVLLEQ